MKEKMVKVKAVKDYYDKELKRNIRVANNETYEVTEERYKVLTGNNPFKEIFVKKVKEEIKDGESNNQSENNETPKDQ
mgnify:FL=1